MKPTRKLRLRLRLIEATLALLLGTLTAGAVATHQLLLDAANCPTTDISFSSGHWTDTLDPARLPLSVPLLDGGTLSVGYLRTDYIYGQNGSGGPSFPDGLQVRGLASDDYVIRILQNELNNQDYAVFGNLFSNSLTVGDSLLVDSYGSVTTPGSLSASYLFVADAAIADSQGYVYTGNQPYHAGAVTPTGYLSFKDSTGSIYYVPAVAQPLP